MSIYKNVGRKGRGFVRDEDLIADIKEFATVFEESDRTATNYKKWKDRKFGKDTIIKRFGNWEAALKASGIRGLTNRHHYSDQELIDHMKAVWDWRGMAPSRANLLKYNEEHGTRVVDVTYVRRWGRYSDTLQDFSELFQEKITKEVFLKRRRTEVRDKPKRDVSRRTRYEVMKRDGFRCQICGKAVDDDVTLHVDHIIPLAKGGSNAKNNLRTLCDGCNLGKSDLLE